MTSRFPSQLTGLQSEITSNQREARSGTALALAATGLQYDQRAGKASIATAVASYKGQSGIAVGFGYAVSDRWRVNAAFTSAPQISDFGVFAQNCDKKSAARPFFPLVQVVGLVRRFWATNELLTNGGDGHA